MQKTQINSQSLSKIQTHRKPFQHRENLRRVQHRSPSIITRTRSKETIEWVEEIVNIFERMPIKDKHFVTAEIKCFMSSPFKYDSHIMEAKLAKSALAKLKNNERFEDRYNFDIKPFFTLSQLIIRKCSDSLQLLKAFEECLKESYPPTVLFMVHYLGVFLLSISSNYEKAEIYCQRMFDHIVRFKIEEYFIIFLYLKVKLKANLSEWENVTKLLSKLLAFAWTFKQQDLEIWCYF